MPRPKQKSPEQFIASSPIGEKVMGGVFERNLASGALRLIEINGEPQELSKLGNKEEKIKGTLKSGYFGIIKPEAINPKSKKLESNELYINAEIEGLLVRRNEVPESYLNCKDGLRANAVMATSNLPTGKKKKMLKGCERIRRKV